jgi:hypothetical protein
MTRFLPLTIGVIPLPESGKFPLAVLYPGIPAQEARASVRSGRWPSRIESP